MTPLDYCVNPITSLRRKPLHHQGLLHKGPHNFVICFFKINFKYYPALFLSMQFMDGLVQNYYPFHYIPSRNKSRLSRLGNPLRHSRKPISYHFRENLEANVKQTDRSVLLNHHCFRTFGSEDYGFEVEAIQRQVTCHILKFSFRNVNHFSHKELKISKKNSFILT
jgi:hypothetical protein